MTAQQRERRRMRIMQRSRLNELQQAAERGVVGAADNGLPEDESIASVARSMAQASTSEAMARKRGS